MPELQVKKVVAICFLEAAKLSLEHIGAFRLELSQQGVPGPADLPRTYGDIRRLRDYLNRCASAYQDTVALDLSPSDACLLVACCRRAIESIEHRLEQGACPEDERQWLIKKRTVLGDWAVELAAKPLIDLPLHRLSTVTTEAMRALNVRLQNKVYGDVTERKKIVPPRSGQVSLTSGSVNFGEQMAESRDSGQEDEPPAAAPRLTNAYVFSEEPEQEAHGSPYGAQLIDPKTLKDPRLRSLATIDLAAFTRCIKHSDFRLATVLLASIMESAVLDHVIPRRSEFGLSGTPDTWNAQELVMRGMGDAAEPKDRSLAFHLFSSRNLLRPSLQMVTPAVVTEASFERLFDFVGRALIGRAHV